MVDAVSATTTGRYDCHNRAPAAPEMVVRAGFHADGRVRFVQSVYQMSRGCRYDRQQRDARCAGCVHIVGAQMGLPL